MFWRYTWSSSGSTTSSSPMKKGDSWIEELITWMIFRDSARNLGIRLVNNFYDRLIAWIKIHLA